MKQILRFVTKHKSLIVFVLVPFYNILPLVNKIIFLTRLEEMGGEEMSVWGIH